MQADALKCALKSAREHADSATRMAAAGILRAISQAGGAALWANGASGYEEVVRLCVGMLEDDNRGVADGFACALGDIAAASRSLAAQEAVGTWQSSVTLAEIASLLGFSAQWRLY